ncbi:MAG TPA: alkaline phosphatase family protein [Candidatus Nanoarchaeia archaeon]|nr:alkaline phosphatase family protein [Candidatus Nanoarchaeia archaeon]
MASRAKDNKVLLLGISGMDYRITRGLMAAGKLPSFKKLAELGSFIKLDSCTPAENNVSWISLATGLNAGKHGFFDAVARKAQTYTPELVSAKIKAAAEIDNKNIKEKLVWEILSKAGFSASAAHWPLSSLSWEIEPDSSQQESAELILQQTSETEKAQERAFWQEFHEFQKWDQGILAFRFDSLNLLQRTFWNDQIIGKENDKITVNKVVVEYYERKDFLLGQILEKIGSTAIIVASNHGITSFERTFHLNTWLAENGFMQLTTELPQAAGSPFFRSVDWDTTRAYALGFSSLYLNLDQREGKGVVKDKERLIKELMTKLESVVDTKTGERIIHKISRREELYSGRYLNDAPDLILSLKPGYQMSWQTAVGGLGLTIIEDNSRGLSGNHQVDPSFIPGVLFSNRKGEKLSASGLDVAPTILEILGVEIPPKMDGKSLLKS